MTPVNICNHAYWNLSGDFAQPTIGDHDLQLPHSSKYVTLSEDQIPTGVFTPVNAPPFDFLRMSRLGAHGRLTGAIKIGNGGQPGIDHPFVIDGQQLDNGSKMAKAAHLKSGSTNMAIYTTQPAIVVYTSNFVAN